MRFLIRLSQTPYKERFVVKGGTLVAGIVGLDHRATMDLDTTLKNMSLDPVRLKEVFLSIFAIPAEDSIQFEIRSIQDIREDDIYGGLQIGITAKYDSLMVPFSMDVTVGDKITPHPVERSFFELFDPSKSYSLWTYNIETILAEKVETLLRRGVFNTRPRDYDDVFILYTTQSVNVELFSKALAATTIHRGSSEQIAHAEQILHAIEESTLLRTHWDRYRRQFSYASRISFEQIIHAIRALMKSIQ